MLPLKRLKWYANLKLIWQAVEPPVVWLCPNCHRYMHNFNKAEFFRDEFEQDEEWHRLCDLYLEGVSLEQDFLREVCYD